TRAVERQETFRREVAGRGQFAEIRLRLEPLAREGANGVGGAGQVLFENALPAGQLPKEFIAAVERGVRGALGRGPLASYPMIDTKGTLLSAGQPPTDPHEGAS